MGRSYTHFDRFRDLVLPNALICAYNGAMIVDTDGRPTYRAAGDAAIARTIEELW